MNVKFTMFFQLDDSVKVLNNLFILEFYMIILINNYNSDRFIVIQYLE